jgi:hypothetical protein
MKTVRIYTMEDLQDLIRKAIENDIVKVKNIYFKRTHIISTTKGDNVECECEIEINESGKWRSIDDE